jgi:hypothetical protein
MQRCERLRVMGCNNVELSSARRQIVLRLLQTGDSVTRCGSSLSKLSHHFSSPPINHLRHKTCDATCILRLFHWSSSASYLRRERGHCNSMKNVLALRLLGTGFDSSSRHRIFILFLSFFSSTPINLSSLLLPSASLPTRYSYLCSHSNLCTQAVQTRQHEST